MGTSQLRNLILLLLIPQPPPAKMVNANNKLPGLVSQESTNIEQVSKSLSPFRRDPKGSAFRVSTQVTHYISTPPGDQILTRQFPVDADTLPRQAPKTARVSTCSGKNGHETPNPAPPNFTSLSSTFYSSTLYYLPRRGRGVGWDILGQFGTRPHDCNGLMLKLPSL
jgi:hypothetical protein